MQTPLNKVRQNAFHNYLVLITETNRKISNGKGHFLPLNLSVKNFFQILCFALFIIRCVHYDT